MRKPPSGRQLYELTIYGEMSDVIRAEFADIEVQISQRKTRLRADLADSAALYGLIGRIEALGLVLLDLHRSGTSPFDEAPSPAATGTDPVPAPVTPPSPGGIDIQR